MIRLARSVTSLLLLLCALAVCLAPVAAAEEAASGQAPTKPLKYVAVGASDALGVGATDPVHDGWVPRFASKLGPNTQVTNLGVYASLVHQAIDEQMPAAIAADPDVITVWLAVNDFDALVPLDTYAADLNTLLYGLRTNTHAQIIVGNVPDMALLLRRDLDPRLLNLVRAYVLRWNATISAVAFQNGAIVADLYGTGTDWQEHPEYVSADGFHPSSAGYARLADAFYATYASTVPTS